ncbi:MAG TPA: hypothetical protein VK563_08740 [Puia sp.]|nr:hypothetical protein [Puia sp.]
MKKYILFVFPFPRMVQQKKIKTVFLAAFTAETLCVTWGLKIPGGTNSISLIYFIAGVSMAIAMLSLPSLSLSGRLSFRALNKRSSHFRLVILGLVALVMYTQCLYWFEEITLDIYNADMLPIIKVMDQRFIAGQWSKIYEPIPEIWKGVQPIYLPAMWQPFVPAVALGIDMRWTTVAGLLFVSGVFIFLYRARAGSYFSFFTGVLAFLLFWWLFADNSPGLITVSEEGVVIAYYVLLVLAIASRNTVLTGVAASLCMLSRYALAGWIPAFLLYLLLKKQYKQALVFSLTGLICLFVLFIGPVGWSTFFRLLHLPGNYIQFAAVVWKDSPAVFSTGIGFAGLFGPHRIVLLHGLLVTLSFLVPFLFVLTGHFRGKKRKIANLPLAALKLSLVIFYSFIDVPYLYLIYTSSFVSLIIVVLMAREEGGSAEPSAAAA